MNYNERLLFYLLRIGLGTESKYDFVFAEKPDWKFIFLMSSKQGVLAIVFDGLEYLISNNLITEDMLPSHALKMQWAMNVMKIENVYNRQYVLANELADIYAKEGIKTVVLKGIASAVLYPKPNHRPCGDLDCFLFDDFEKGIKVAVDNGAKYEGRDTKHAHINYKGLEIENHKFCTAICGAEKKKDFERSLQSVLKDKGVVCINNTNLLSPDPLFNALFLTEHTWRHFLGMEVGLRQFCDIAVLLKHHNDDIDWKRFEAIISKRDKNLMRFARCASVIAHVYMGTPIPSIFADSCECDELTNRMVKGLLYDNGREHVPAKGHFGHYYGVIRNMLKSNWRIDEFSEDSAPYITFTFLLEHVFERHPHL